MHKKYLSLTVIAVGVIVALSGFQITPATGGTPIDIGSSITTVGQYALLAWLVVRGDQKANEIQRAWAEERKWMIELLVRSGIKREQ